MKILVLCGDPWHPVQTARQGLCALPGPGDWIEDARDWSPEMLRAYPLVILTKSNNASSSEETTWMTEEAQAAFADYVRRGNGLLAIHSGIAGYEQCKLLRSLLGGVFVHHPEQCPVTVTPRAGHPLTGNSHPFTLQDEHYFVALDDPTADVFLTTTSENGEQPGGWRREEGSGRVAVLTPGHNLEVWLHPDFQSLIVNSLRWCARWS